MPWIGLWHAMDQDWITDIAQNQIIYVFAVSDVTRTFKKTTIPAEMLIS